MFDLDGKLIGLIYSGHHLVVGYPRPVRVPVGVAQVLPADFILHLLGRG
ncbi:MAG: hypothetical protein GWN58_57615 [Anaerolineae bacterium]|nr:hypothetical protein [Anaerolineae bacterium]